MEPEDIVQKLNELVDSDDFDLTILDSLIKQFKDKFNTNVKFLDFEFDDEARMLAARSNKISMEKIRDFDAAYEFREIERECQKYIAIKTKFNFKNSIFYFEKNYLYYFCSGTAKNDKVVRDNLSGGLNNPYAV